MNDKTTVSQSHIAMHDETPSVMLVVDSDGHDTVIVFWQKNRPKARPSIKNQITNMLMMI